MNTTVTFRWNEPALNYVLRDRSGPVGHEIDRRGQLVATRARQQAPRRSGRLAGSITTRSDTERDGPVTYIGATAPYANIVQFGRGPVRPHRARFLHWTDTTGDVFARQTRGSPANPFLTRALEAAR